jgi:hypothetical protein
MANRIHDIVNLTLFLLMVPLLPVTWWVIWWVVIWLGF